MEIGFVAIARSPATRAAVGTVAATGEIARAAPDLRPTPAPASGLGVPSQARQIEGDVIKATLDAEPRARDAAARDTAPTAQLSEAEQAQVDALAARDREVRNHEEAHARVGGPYAGTPSYSFQEGPDGKQYAVGGEVAIDVSPVPDDPEATIIKMEVVKAAALAPAEPSGQDRRVAALADAQRQQAIADLAALRRQTEPLAQPSFDLAA